MQLRIFCFGLLEDGDVGVGVFPEGEEIVVGGGGLGGVTLHGIGTGEAEMGGYGGRPMRRSRSAKRRSERRGSNRGSTVR